MSGFCYFLVSLFFNSLWTFTRSDSEVYCQFSSTCILPCSFPVADEILIHWIQVSPNKHQAHSYYNNQDKLGLQDAVFKGRTSLYLDQISKGNASLRLSGVEVRDEGRYQCYTSTINGNKETFLQLKVYAPVQEVTIKKLENGLTCSSDGIYPRPTLTWTVHSQPGPQTESSVSQTEQQLYRISSSVPLPAADVDYSCTVSSAKSQRKATIFKETQKNSSNADVTVTCHELNSEITNLIWRFNHSQVILTWVRGEGYEASDDWSKHVKEVSDGGTVTLTDLTPSQQGTYTCEARNAEESGTASTFLHITAGVPNKTAGIIAGVIVAVLLIATAAGIFFCCKKKKRNRPSNSAEKQPMNKHNGT